MDVHNTKATIEPVDPAIFASILETAVLALGFEEAWYLNKYPDIRKAVEAGEMPSALYHYVAYGFREGRQPYPIIVDSTFYLGRYPDVQHAVQQGEFRNAQDHYDLLGRLEGRLPYEGYEPFKRRKGTSLDQPAHPRYIAAASRIKDRFERGARLALSS